MFGRLISLAAMVALLVAHPAHASDNERLKVVASFSILADFAKAVGGDRIDVTALVGADGDSHVFTPTPADARTVASAKLVIINGLGFEGWLPRLMEAAQGASGPKLAIVEAAKGVAPRKAEESEHDHGHDHGHSHDHGDAHGEVFDPHAWQSVANAKIYVGNIRDALIAVDPNGTDSYRANADAYLAELDGLDRDVRAAVEAIPATRRKVISSHDAFGYFADAYGVSFIAPQGVSTDSEPSARAVAMIIRQIKKQKIPAVFLENMTNPRLMRRIASETKAKIGGTLYADSLTAENGDAPTYITMVRHNIRTLKQALAD